MQNSRASAPPPAPARCSNLLPNRRWMAGVPIGSWEACPGSLASSCISYGPGGAKPGSDQATITVASVPGSSGQCVELHSSPLAQ
eukprot:365994-Chlamydomonas_euryale.AAC.22